MLSHGAFSVRELALQSSLCLLFGSLGSTDINASGATGNGWETHDKLKLCPLLFASRPYWMT